MLVLRMLLLLLKPLFTEAWSWLSVRNNLMTKETLLYLDIATVSKKNLSSQSFSGQDFSNSRRNLGKSSSKNDLNSDDALSQLCGDVTFKSTKRSKSIFHFWSNLSLGIEIILQGSKTLVLRRIFDPRGLLSKSYSSVAIMYLWQPFLNSLIMLRLTVSDFFSFWIAWSTENPRFILSSGSLDSSQKLISFSWWTFLHDLMTDDLITISSNSDTIAFNSKKRKGTIGLVVWNFFKNGSIKAT